MFLLQVLVQNVAQSDETPFSLSDPKSKQKVLGLRQRGVDIRARLIANVSDTFRGIDESPHGGCAVDDPRVMLDVDRRGDN